MFNFSLSFAGITNLPQESIFLEYSVVSIISVKKIAKAKRVGKRP